MFALYCTIYMKKAVFRSYNFFDKYHTAVIIIVFHVHVKVALSIVN